MKEYLVWHMNAKYVAALANACDLIIDAGLGIKKSRARAMCRPGLSRQECFNPCSDALAISMRAILKIWAVSSSIHRLPTMKVRKCS